MPIVKQLIIINTFFLNLPILIYKMVHIIIAKKQNFETQIFIFLRYRERIRFF
jgi:hypothetical protein